jgi:hypothetical protein
MDIPYPVPCPLLGAREIDIGTCFDIHMVVEGTAPKYTAPKEIYNHEDYVEICQNCPFHRDD